MTDLQNIQWKRIVVEAAAIVISILLAFAIDAWWEDHQRKSEEQVILASLYKEAQEIVSLIDETRIYTAGLRDATRRVYNVAAASESEVTDAEIDQFLVELLWHINPSVTNAPVLESIVGSGDLEVISSGELRRQLGSVTVFLAALKDEIIRDSDYYNSTFLPYIQTHAFLGQVYSLESRWPGFSERVYPPYDLVAVESNVSNREVFKSHKFQNLLLHRLTTTTNILEWYQSDEDPQLKILVKLIERELKIQTDG